MFTSIRLLQTIGILLSSLSSFLLPHFASAHEIPQKSSSDTNWRTAKSFSWMLEIALLYLPKVDKIYAYCMPLKEYF